MGTDLWTVRRFINERAEALLPQQRCLRSGFFVDYFKVCLSHLSYFVYTHHFFSNRILIILHAMIPPVQKDGRVFGVIGIELEGKRPVGTNDKNLLHVLLDETAVTVKSLLLHRDL